MRKSLITASILSAFVSGQAFSFELFGSKDDFPPLEAFIKPPFTLLEQGFKPQVDPEYLRMPVLRAGEIVAFYLTHTGEIKSLYCDETSKVVEQPTETVKLENFNQKGNLFTDYSEIKLKKSTLKTGADATSASLTVKRSDSTENISSLSSSTSVATERDSSDVASKQSQTAVATVNERSSNSSQAAQLTIKDSEQTRSEQQSEKISTEVKTAQAAQKNIESVTTKDQTVDRRERSRSGLGTATFLSEARYSRGTGGFFSLDDGGFLQTIFGEDVLGNIDGETNLLLEYDADTLLSINESMQAWLALVDEYSNDNAVIKYLDGLATARFRKDAETVENPQYKAKMECGFVSHAQHGKVFHGHPYGIKITVTNQGNMPLYDLLVMTSPSEYSVFTLAPEDTETYSVNFLHKQKTVLIRNFAPVKANGKFRTVYIGETDPWYVKSGK